MNARHVRRLSSAKQRDATPSFLPLPTQLVDKVVAGDDEASSSKDAIKEIIGSIEPDFMESHIESKLNLDQRV